MASILSLRIVNEREGGAWDEMVLVVAAGGGIGGGGRCRDSVR